MDWPGEKLLIRLWETIEKSGTGLFRPWQSARVGKAEAEVTRDRMLLIAAAEREIEARRNVHSPELSISVAPSLTVQNSLQERVDPVWSPEAFSIEFTSAQKAEYLRKEVNIERAIYHAESSLQQDASDPPDQTPDMDWFFRWRDYAAGMSSDALQQLWGNVLAGELKAPGSFNYRTLDFLRSLTQEEAKLIERLASNIVEDSKFIHGKSMTFMGKERSVASRVDMAELRLLEEIGLLNGVSTLGFFDRNKPFKVAEGRYIHLIACGGRGVLATTEDPDKETGLTFYLLTKLGKSVLKLVQVVPDEAHLLSIAQLLASDGFKMELGDVLKKGDKGREFINSTPIEPLPDGESTVIA
ncbi:hypothetical protein J2W27_004300 [Variovorax boronicumulans]|uniref:DUF2806 domain-containing protein n=1 Tax=Variovorax boronicumulans TaxID=436515 RepID=UPI00277E5777|nr:DUF2806 domain-containing protein [Variovorax boronicumulans]MDP9912176.1 hypothetical protein [Variovorax boronicumulans]